MAFATSLPQIDVSVAYAVWSACGTALVSAVMILGFGETADPIKLLCIACIILGVVGLNLRDSHLG
jgi:small multidrug resistance pump